MRDWPWEADGLCREVDPELFFPQEGSNPRVAKTICARCSVESECLDFAMLWDVVGVWGGTTEKERRALRGGAARRSLGY